VLVTGYPVVFGFKSVDLGGFIEIVRPEAVDHALRTSADVVALRNHDSNMPLGRRSAGTLALTKDARGLHVEIDADSGISYASDLARIIKRGDAVGGSFGFRVLEDIWSFEGGIPLRELLSVDLREISVGVTFPAYPNTELGVQARGQTTRHRREDSRSNWQKNNCVPSGRDKWRTDEHVQTYFSRC